MRQHIPQPIGKITLESIQQTISKYGGTFTCEQNLANMPEIDPGTYVLITCKEQHSWSCQAAFVNEGCAICHIIDIMAGKSVDSKQFSGEVKQAIHTGAFKIVPVPVTTEKWRSNEQNKTNKPFIDGTLYYGGKKKDIQNYSEGMVPMQTTYSSGQIKFPFKCPKNHICTMTPSNCSEGCRTCRLERHVEGEFGDMQFDTACVNDNQYSLLRMHCNRWRHNPNCENPACIDILSGRVENGRLYGEGCTNMVRCDQDIIATPLMIVHNRWLCNCQYDHEVKDDFALVETIRVLEALYNDRMDAFTQQVHLTAYNPRFNIACIHDADKPSKDNLAYASDWAESNGIKLIRVTKADKTTEEILRTCVHGIMGKDHEGAGKVIAETKMILDHARKIHKPYANRCVYMASTVDYQRSLTSMPTSTSELNPNAPSYLPSVNALRSSKPRAPRAPKVILGGNNTNS